MRHLATVLGVEIEFPAPGGASTDDGSDQARAETVALFRDVREPLGRYLASLGARQPEIEEIVQEAFLRLHKQLSTGHQRLEAAPQNLQGWVFRVAQNLLRDRRRGWHGRNIESIEDRPEAALASAPGATPEERVLHIEKMKRLRACLEALPEQHRRCLHLRAEGLRYREIAAALGVSITTVADMIREALAQLERAR
jgi:RNA polymerase sigma-70 factor (ECF subfamily)